MAASLDDDYIEVDDLALPTTIVTDTNALDKMINAIYANQAVAWDHETRAADYDERPKDGALRWMNMKSDLTSFSTDDQAWVIPTGMVFNTNMEEADFWPNIKDMMEDPEILCLGYNAPFDMNAMANNGIWVSNVQDVMVMAHLLDEERPRTLKNRCADVGLELHAFPFKEYWSGRHQYQNPDFEVKPRDVILPEVVKQLEDRYLAYSAEDSIATIKLYRKYRQQLEDEGLWNLFINNANPAIRTTFNMQRRGMRLDTDFLRAVGDKCTVDMEAAELEVYEEAGEHFKIGSTAKLGEILYENMGLPVYKTTAKGANSTDAESLQRLAQDGYGIAQKILEYRRLNKLFSTYMGAEAKLIRDTYKWSDTCEYIHGNFNTCATATGRLSSSGPNLQNFPQSHPGTYHFRKAFIPSPGHVLIGGDYSQIELRIAGNQSQDPGLLGEYGKDGEIWEALNGGMDLEEAEERYSKSDIHQATADAAGSTRQVAKSINFGVVYMMGSRSLASVITMANWADAQMKGRKWDRLVDVVDEIQAQEFINNYFTNYPGVRAYQEYISNYVKQTGYVKTPFGRIRRLPDVFLSDRGLAKRAQRQAVNFTIQGSVGEIMIHNMNLIERSVHSKRKDIRDAVDCLWDCKFRLTSQVHDEVIGEVVPEYAKQCKTALTYIFQNPLEPSKGKEFAGFRVPLVFEAKTGPNWALIH